MPARKPPGRRQNRSTKDVGSLAIVRDDVKIPPPPHPPKRKLLAQTVRAWGDFWTSEMAGMVKPADMLSLQRLFRLYDLRERLERIFLEAPFVEGSTGQVVAHPAGREIASIDARIDKLEPRFGLTPKGRLELGIAFGAAAKSLEDVNRDFDSDAEDDTDPRLEAVADEEPVEAEIVEG